jgi:ribosomal protein S18 acetylase RimI-like enzyme
VADAPAGLTIRRARDDDAPAVALLVHSTASVMYDLLLGNRERALRFIERGFRAAASNVSREVTWVADRGGEVVGALVAYPAGASAALARRLAWMVLQSTPPWRWPSVLRLQWLGERHAPRPAPGSLYVDALATDPAHRRGGVATALLRRAEEHARAVGLGALSVDTPDSNEGGLALYLSAGFEVVERRETKPPLPAAVLLVKELG